MREELRAPSYMEGMASLSPSVLAFEPVGALAGGGADGLDCAKAWLDGTITVGASAAKRMPGSRVHGRSTCVSRGTYAVLELDDGQPGVLAEWISQRLRWKRYKAAIDIEARQSRRRSDFAVKGSQDEGQAGAQIDMDEDEELLLGWEPIAAHKDVFGVERILVL